MAKMLFLLVFMASLLIGPVYMADGCPDCPKCFNCLLPSDVCTNGGQCNSQNGKCANCPAGFGGDSCGLPLCLSPANPSRRPLQPSEESCPCDEDWFGVNCNVCRNDSVCQTYRQDSNATCLIDSLIVKNHFRQCDAKLPEWVQEYIPKGKDPMVTLGCENTGSVFDPFGCSFQFWMGPKEETFFCDLRNCQMKQDYKYNQSYTCETASCYCIRETFLCSSTGVDFQDLLDQVKGPVYLDCVDTHNCTFREEMLDGVFDGGVKLDCVSGECLLPSELPGYIPPPPPPPIPPPPPNYAFIVGLSLGSIAVLGGAVAGFLYLVKRQKRMVNSEVDPTIDDEADKLKESHIPAVLSFDNLSYHIGGMAILNGISGVVAPGHVMAIIGGSGAGKTSCLDILAGKSKKGVVKGKVLVNGIAMDPKEFRRIVGYVDQEDTLLGTLTVRETLMYSAMLRLPKTMSLTAKKVRVQQTMIELGIDHIADRKVGVPGRRGISGGEKRRVSIAQELVTSPSILFLDEPTSGLDAYNAFVVVDTIVKLAKNYNRTVIFTIHQPRTNIFAKFDQLLVLAAGELIYSGPAAGTSAHFGAIGFPIPALYNPADYLIDLTLKPEEEMYSDESLEDISSEILSEGESFLNSFPSGSIGNVHTPFAGDQKLADVKIETSRSPTRVPNTSGMDSPSKLLASREPSPVRSEIRLPGPRFDEDVIETRVRRHSEHRPIAHGRRQKVYSWFSHVSRKVMGQKKNPSSNGSRMLHKRKSTHEMNEVERRIGRLVLAFKESAVGKDLVFNLGQVAEMSSTSEAIDSIRALSKRSNRISFSRQVSILSGRTILNLYRNPFLMISHYGVSLVMAVLVGFIFWQVEDNIAGVQNRLGCIFFSLVFFGFGSLTTLDLFAPERLLFTRERANGFYGSFAYFLSKVLFDIIPLRVVPPTLYGSIIYYMVGLYDDSMVLLNFLLILILFNLSISSMCLIIAILFKQASLGNLVASLCMLFSMLFSGFLLNKGNLPGLVFSLVNISPFNYAFEAMAVNELEKITIKDPQLLNIPIKGQKLLDIFGFKTGRFEIDVMALSLTFLIFLNFAFLLLKFVVREQR